MRVGTIIEQNRSDVARWVHATKVSTPPIPILLPPGLTFHTEVETRKSHSRDEPLNQSEFDPEKSTGEKLRNQEYSSSFSCCTVVLEVR